MPEQTQGVIAAARAAAPVAVPPASTSTAPAPVTPAMPAQQQGFGGNQPQNGFAPQPAPVAAPEPVAQPTAPIEPVVTDSDRTRQQFEKLVETNQRIAQQNDLLRQQLDQQMKQRQQSNQQFAPVQQTPTQVPQQSALPKLSDYVEIDEQGNRFVNEQKFNAAVADIYQKASRAEETVKNYVQTAEQREIERQEREAFSSHPNLNPRDGSFDPRLSQNTRAIIYDSMINPQDYGGRPLSFKEAADFVVRGMGGQPVSVPAVPTPVVNTENQVQKEQAALSAQNVPQQVMQTVDQDREFNRLVQGTRLGSDEAIAVRLLNAPHRIEEVERLGGN